MKFRFLVGFSPKSAAIGHPRVKSTMQVSILNYCYVVLYIGKVHSSLNHAIQASANVLSLFTIIIIIIMRVQWDCNLFAVPPSIRH